MSNWIRTDERLPVQADANEDRCVWVTDSNGKTSFKHYSIVQGSPENYKAWKPMPLPAPYETPKEWTWRDRRSGEIADFVVLYRPYKWGHSCPKAWFTTREAAAQYCAGKNGEVS